MPGKYEIDALTLSTAKLVALTKKFDQMHINSVGTLHVPNLSCEICRSTGNIASEYPLGNSFPQDPSIEQAKFVNNSNQFRLNDPFSNTYNSSGGNHSNFSYMNNQNMAPQTK